MADPLLLLNHLVEVTATEVTAAVVEAVEDLPATDTDRLLVLSPQRQFNPEATAEATDQLYLLLLRRRRRRWIRPRRIGTSPLYINRWIWPMDPSSSNKEATVELAEGEAVTAKAEVRPTFARLLQSVQVGDEMKKKESGKGKGKRKEKVENWTNFDNKPDLSHAYRQGDVGGRTLVLHPTYTSAAY